MISRAGQARGQAGKGAGRQGGRQARGQAGKGAGRQGGRQARGQARGQARVQTCRHGQAGIGGARGSIIQTGLLDDPSKGFVFAWPKSITLIPLPRFCQDKSRRGKH